MYHEYNGLHMCSSMHIYKLWWIRDSYRMWHDDVCENDNRMRRNWRNDDLSNNDINQLPYTS
jgi:hypothetical protein